MMCGDHTHAVQWDRIVRIGPVSPLSLQHFGMARSGGLGVWLQVVWSLHRRLSDFVGFFCTAGRKLSGGGGTG